MTRLRGGARTFVTIVAAYAGYMVVSLLLSWVWLDGFAIFAWLALVVVSVYALTQTELPTKFTEFRDEKPLDLDEEFRLLMEKQNNG